MERGKLYSLPPEYLFANGLVFASQDFVSPQSLMRAVTYYGQRSNPSSKIMYGVQVGQSTHLIIGDGHHRVCEDLFNGNTPTLTFDGWLPHIDLRQLAEIYNYHSSQLSIHTEVVKTRILERGGYLGIQTLVPFSDFYDTYCRMRSELY